MNFSIQKLPIKKLVNGTELFINVYQFDSEKKGPSVYLQANVHGAEIQGNILLHQLMRYLKDNSFSGKVTIVPHANPMSVNFKVGTHTYGRFNPITGDNWNRNYTDLGDLFQQEIKQFAKDNRHKDEQSIKEDFKNFLNDKIFELFKENKYRNSENKFLNLKLQQLSSSADIILDLHTGQDSARYLYVFEDRSEDIPYFGFPNNILIPKEFAGAMDEASYIPWKVLESCFSDLGKNYKFDIASFTLELGSEEIISDKENQQKDFERLINYLSYKGVFKNEIKTYSKQLVNDLDKFKIYFSNHYGLCEFLVNPGESFKKGDKIAKFYQLNNIEILEDLEKEIFFEAPKDGTVIFRCNSSAISEGMELFYVLEH